MFVSLLRASWSVKRLQNKAETISVAYCRSACQIRSWHLAHLQKLGTSKTGISAPTNREQKHITIMFYGVRSKSFIFIFFFIFFSLQLSIIPPDTVLLSAYATLPCSFHYLCQSGTFYTWNRPATVLLGDSYYHI